jgi:type I restriction enzyme M protein
MREVLEKFDFDNTLGKLEEAGLLFRVLERFRNVDLHPEKVDNATMGTIFEELIRRFNEALDENPGEHFTPRDVVHLMVDLMLAGDEARLARRGVVLSVCDPCCGSGGMLTITTEHVTAGVRRNGDLIRPPVNPAADVHLFGQEVNPETWAVSKSDLFMKEPTGRDADRIAFGSVLAIDRHAGQAFDHLIANPPYGKDWKRDEDAVRAEHERGAAGRGPPGLPRINDGQLLFLLHMLAHRKDAREGGSRIAIIMNGSPLFTGDAGSGESEIRRWILEQDWLEALIALPEQLFYNTSIATYVWVLTNRKAAERRGLVQLIDATSFWTPMRKSLGDKRREIPPERADDIVKLVRDFKDGDTRPVTRDGKTEEVPVSKVFPTTHFGFRKITAMNALPEYLLDANVFIEAARRYYAFDLVPRFWTSLVELGRSGRGRSIDRVRDELERGRDRLAEWAVADFADGFLPPSTEAVLAEFRASWNGPRRRSSSLLPPGNSLPAGPTAGSSPVRRRRATWSSPKNSSHPMLGEES